MNKQERIQAILEQTLLQFTLSGSKEIGASKQIKGRMVEIKNKLQYQIEWREGSKILHRNLDKEEIESYLLNVFGVTYQQLNGTTKTHVFQSKVNKRGTLLYTQKQQEQAELAFHHNQVKEYLVLQEGVSEPLVDLGIITKNGIIVKGMQDKLTQIDRFVRNIEEVVKGEYPDPFYITEFGCGNSYLTFVLYDYLVRQKKCNVKMVGIDKNTELITRCNTISKKYGYEHLTFENKQVESYASDGVVDMVISLHACNTATDYGIYYGIQSKAKWIITAPCCQQELLQQLRCNSQQLGNLSPYGLIQERQAALLTDTMRGLYLESQGYTVDMVEFVQLENSPKNILIRAKKKKESNLVAQQTVLEWERRYQINPTLKTLLNSR